MEEEQDSRTTASIGQKRARDAPNLVSYNEPNHNRTKRRRRNKKGPQVVVHAETAFFTEESSEEGAIHSDEEGEDGSDEFASDVDIDADDVKTQSPMPPLGLDGASDYQRYPVSTKAKTRQAEPVEIIDLESDPEPSDADSCNQNSHPQSHIKATDDMRTTTSNDKLIRLQDLPHEERRLQTLYWSLHDPTSLVCCPICSIEGHMSSSCPSRKCIHCGTLDQHFSSACPSYQKCPRCGERGHDTARCPSKLARSTAAGDTYISCDTCGGDDHEEETCAWIWRTFRPEEVQLVPVKPLMIWCYECGSQRHWGDDCPTRLRGKVIHCDTFSAKYVNGLKRGAGGTAIGAAPLERQPDRAGINIRGRAAPNAQHPYEQQHQQYNKRDGNADTDDDSITFLGNRIKANVKRAANPPSIHIRSVGGGGRADGGVSLGGQYHGGTATYESSNGFRALDGYQGEDGEYHSGSGRFQAVNANQGREGYSGGGGDQYRGGGGGRGRRGNGGGVMLGGYHAMPPPAQLQQASNGGGGGSRGKRGKRAGKHGGRRRMLADE